MFPAFPRASISPIRRGWARRSGPVAEGDVEGDDFGAIFAEDVEHIRKMRSGERPLSEHFLGMLIDVHDNDAGRWAWRRAAVAETRIHESYSNRWMKLKIGVVRSPTNVK